MMKKSLLFAVALFASLGVSAQVKTAVASLSHPSLVSTDGRPQAMVQEMQMHAAGETVSRALNSSGLSQPYYCRPAGAFYSFMMVEGDNYSSNTDNDCLLLKPYSEYTFSSVLDGVVDSARCVWLYGTSSSYYPRMNLTTKYDIGVCQAPMLQVYENGDPGLVYTFQYPYMWPLYDDYIGMPVAEVYSIPSMDVISGAEGRDFLLSSKTMCQGGRSKDAGLSYRYVTYTGAAPSGGNENGWWFGKNASHIDGIAQAFEKPEHPYLLKKVYVELGYVECVSEVDLTCKIYRLDKIPAYDDNKSVELPSDLGEPIFIGRGKVRPNFGKLLSFDLYKEEDGLEVKCTPTIDYPILIVFDGYNDAAADGLVDFTCYIAANIHDDEGYGELAYMKSPVKDDEGNFTGEYVWKGLNNFFGEADEMKSGFSIFITADMPYLVFKHEAETGEYVFPDEGGELQQQFGDETMYGIEFKSWVPSSDDAWTMTWDGDEVLPDWLEIDLADDRDDDGFNGIVTAIVSAEPLPAGVSYREAVIRFEYPGAYIDYKFIQGNMTPPCPPYNIADVNYTIDLIFRNSYDSDYDLNQDGEISIADINMLIDIILSY